MNPKLKRAIAAVPAIATALDAVLTSLVWDDTGKLIQVNVGGRAVWNRERWEARPLVRRWRARRALRRKKKGEP